jgi:ABC-2 type transport system permease protein
MNVYLHELRCYRKNTLLWIVSLGAGVALLFWMFPAFAQNIAPLQQMLANFPMVIQIAFGLSVESIGSVTGFYAFAVTFLMVCGAVQAMYLGLSVMTKEHTGKTADFLLTKPLTRVSVLTAKLLATFTCVAVTSAVYVAVSAAAAAAVSTSPVDYPRFLLMSLAFFFIQVIFLAMGFCVGAVVPKIRSVLPVSLSTVFGFFIVGMAAAALERQDLYYLSPFKYFDTLRVLQKSSYQTSFLVAGAAVTALCVLAGYVVYTRRDIRAA